MGRNITREVYPTGELEKFLAETRKALDLRSIETFLVSADKLRAVLDYIDALEGVDPE